MQQILCSDSAALFNYQLVTIGPPVSLHVHNTIKRHCQIRSILSFRQDPDDNANGVGDENELDTDGDGIPDYLDEDDDGDGITDDQGGVEIS